jgi:serine/threonine protein kinase
MAATTLDTTFLQRLEKCRLVSPEQIAAATAATGGSEPQLSRYLVQQGLLTRFQASQLRSGVTRFHVDKYVVVDYIGRGGHSLVFKARHTLLPNRHVALKVFDASSLHHHEDVLARFRREVEIVARLDHPNVVRAYDVVENRSQLYLVLEYVDGCDLAQLVSQFGPLPVADAAGYAVQAARGLAYAHRCGIVHRDVKPANLLLARDGLVKLADLGLAKFLAAEPPRHSSGSGTKLGTPAFMAPEQAEDVHHADARSDLYSLGTTLYHLLTGALPLKGTSYLQQLQQLLVTTPRPLAEARADVPPGLAAVVDRLRARDPDQRPASADEAATLLEPFARSSAPDPAPAHWDGRRKAALVLEVLRGRTDAAAACTTHGLTTEDLERWQQRFLEGAARALDPNAATANVSEDTLHALYAKIGAQAMEIESLKRRG